MEKRKNYQSPRTEVHSVSVFTHMLTGSQAGPSANYMQNPGVRSSRSVSSMWKGGDSEVEE